MNLENIKIENYGKDSVVYSPMVALAHQVEDPRTIDRGNISPFDWSVNQGANFFEDLEIIPYGYQNDLPQILRDTVYNNSSIPGVFEKKQGLLWGQGPLLYAEKFEKSPDNKNIRVREWQDNKAIQDWLDSWDYQDYLLSAITDFNFIQGSFTKFIRTNGSKIGRNKFHSLENLGAHNTRLARRLGSEKATHAIFSDIWRSINPNTYRVYNLYDSSDPFANPNPVMYSRTKTFGTDHYSIPTIYGALEWIRRSTAVPLILRALSKNSMFAKYHLTSPAKFWDKIREQLEDKAMNENREFREKDMQDYERELLKTIVQTLSNEENAGKLLHTKNIVTQDGMSIIEQGWTITPIQENSKDFVDTQIKIADKSDSAVATAIGIHKALGGMSAAGSADSGSEQLYAYLMFKLIGVDIPEFIVTKAINAAIKANFPGTSLKLGFYHEEAQRMQDQTSKDRVKNNA